MTRRILPITLLLAACSSTPTVATTTAPPPPETTVTATADPYQTYLSLPGADPTISAEDAQTRALLGCKLTFAPNTVDAALQQAYAGLIEEWRKQGWCGAVTVTKE